MEIFLTTTLTSLITVRLFSYIFWLCFGKLYIFLRIYLKVLLIFYISGLSVMSSFSFIILLFNLTRSLSNFSVFLKNQLLPLIFPVVFVFYFIDFCEHLCNLFFSSSPDFICSPFSKFLSLTLNSLHLKSCFSFLI